MPPKKKSAGKKKGGSAKAKKAPEPAVPAEPPGPEWPWTKARVAWMGKDPVHRDRVLAVFREAYVQTDGIVYTQAEWDATVRCYMGPLSNPDAESMVQMLATALARRGTRTARADNFKTFCAALRSRHSPAHFARMFSMVVGYFQRTDGGPSIQVLLDVFQTANPEHETDALIDRARTLVNRLLITVGKMEAAKNAAAAAAATGADMWRRDDLDKGLMYVFMEFLQDQKERLITLFNAMDKDRSGTITREEFKNGMQALGIPGTDKQLDELIEELDTDGDGDINYKEMAAGRAMQVEKRRLSATMRAEALAQEAAARAAAEARAKHVMEHGEPEAPSLTMDWDEFVNLLIHCHYSTRP